MTPVARIIREEILLGGPISVERYMALCLNHYYASRDPLGMAGDFITAPEISQMFGELIGLWMAECWHLLGAPSKGHWVELGPGRGTLTSDAFRAARLVPAFREALDIHLVETSPALRLRQKETLAPAEKTLTWHEAIAGLPEEGPLFVVANEFFDALPVQQFTSRDGEWRQRCVGLDDNDGLSFGLFPSTGLNLELPPCEGKTIERPVAATVLMAELAQRIARQGGIMLAIDYGYAAPAYGDSLQALRNHAYAPVLEAPGEADLTTHVCFQHLADAAQAQGLAVHGLATQRQFLDLLGIGIRAATLIKACPAEADSIEAAKLRLTEGGIEGMGELFKVMALSSPNLVSLPGLLACETGRLHSS